MNHPLKYIFALILVGTFGISFSQIKEERIRATRTEQPDVKKIVKKKPVADEPPIVIKDDSLKYSIKDVEAVSDFKTSQIPPQEISTLPNDFLYNNYVKAGYGSLSTLKLDAFLTYNIDSNMRIGGNISHHSTKGIKDLDWWESKYSNSNIEVFLNNQLKKGVLEVRGLYGIEKINYYGIPDTLYIDKNRTNDLENLYKKFGVQASYDAFLNNYFDKANVSLQTFGDNFQSKETVFDANIYSIKDNLIDLELLNAPLGFEAQANINYATVSFNEIVADTQYKYLTAFFQPSLTFKGERLQLKVGAKGTYLGESESKENKFYIYPKVDMSFQLQPSVALIAGVDGDISANLFSDLVQQNPYLLPHQILEPTQTVYNVYAGLKGDIGTNFKYTTKFNFINQENMHFFTKSSYLNFPQNIETKAYNHNNTFSSVYDNGKIFRLSGELKYVAIDNLNVGLNVEFNQYTLDSLQYAYYKPTYRADISADYHMFQKKLLLGAKLYFVGQRDANDYVYSDAAVVPVTYVETQKTLDSYVDFNLSASYKILPQLSVYVNALNLLNAEYEPYIHYQAQGLQLIGGLLFKF